MTSYAEFGQPPSRVMPGHSPPPVYAYLAGLPEGTVVVEFPFGETGWDIRAVYYSTMHWKPLVNGYSGGFPERYIALARLLYNVEAAPEAAWAALRDTGPTHAVVHLDAFRGSSIGTPEPWLMINGGRLVASFPDVRVYALPPASRRIAGAPARVGST
jgi:hypothetical protein